MRTSYITVDLDLESSADLSWIKDSGSSEGVTVHYCGPGETGHRATLGVAGFDENEDHAIGVYAAFLKANSSMLSATEARIIFNIGYEAGDEFSVWRSTLSSASISAIAAIGGEIMVTIYRRESDDA